MPRHVLTGQQRRPARHADRRRHPRLPEVNALGREPVEVGRADNAVAGRADGIPARVVDDEDHDVHGRGRLLPAAERRGETDAENQGDCRPTYAGHAWLPPSGGRLYQAIHRLATATAFQLKLEATTIVRTPRPSDGRCSSAIFRSPTPRPARTLAHHHVYRCTAVTAYRVVLDDVEARHLIRLQDLDEALTELAAPTNRMRNSWVTQASFETPGACFRRRCDRSGAGRGSGQCLPDRVPASSSARSMARSIASAASPDTHARSSRATTSRSLTSV